MEALDNIINEFNTKYKEVYSADYYTQKNCDSPTYRLFNSDGKPIIWFMWGCITFKTDVIFSLETVLAAGELFGSIAKFNKEHKSRKRIEMAYGDFDRVDINEFFDEFMQKYDANGYMYPSVFLDFTYGWTLVLIQGFEDKSSFPYVLFDESNYTFVKTNSPVFDSTFIKDFKETVLQYFKALGLQLTEKESE